MRIFNETKSIELVENQCDLSKGYLKPEKLKTGERQSIVEEKVNLDGTITAVTHPAVAIEEDILVYVPYTQKQLYIKEKQELEHWFETEYREMFEKCSRKIALGLTMRDGSDPRTKLSQLYTQAETNSNRINQLKQFINY